MQNEKLSIWMLDHPHLYQYLGEGASLKPYARSLLLLGPEAEELSPVLAHVHPYATKTVLAWSDAEQFLANVSALEEGAFDYMVAPLLLELFPSRLLASFLIEVKRVLSPGGLLYLSFPDNPSPISAPVLKVPVYYDPDTVREEKRYAVEDVVGSISVLGLQMLSIHRNTDVDDLLSVVTLLVRKPC